MRSWPQLCRLGKWAADARATPYISAAVKRLHGDAGTDQTGRAELLCGGRCDGRMRSHHLNLTDERSKENSVRGARQYVRRANHTPNRACVNTYFCELSGASVENIRLTCMCSKISAQLIAPQTMQISHVSRHHMTLRWSGGRRAPFRSPTRGGRRSTAHLPRAGVPA